LSVVRPEDVSKAVVVKARVGSVQDAVLRRLLKKHSTLRMIIILTSVVDEAS
jgi:hypothetical protein